METNEVGVALETTPTIVVTFLLVVLGMIVGGLLFAGGEDADQNDEDPDLPDSDSDVDPDWIQSQDREGGA